MSLPVWSHIPDRGVSCRGLSQADLHIRGITPYLVMKQCFDQKCLKNIFLYTCPYLLLTRGTSSSESRSSKLKGLSSGLNSQSVVWGMLNLREY